MERCRPPAATRSARSAIHRLIPNRDLHLTPLASGTSTGHGLRIRLGHCPSPRRFPAATHPARAHRAGRREPPPAAHRRIRRRAARGSFLARGKKERAAPRRLEADSRRQRVAAFRSHREHRRDGRPRREGTRTRGGTPRAVGHVECGAERAALEIDKAIFPASTLALRKHPRRLFAVHAPLSRH